MIENLEDFHEQMQKIEFHRNTFVLIPENSSKVFDTFLIESQDKKENNRLFCSCTKRGKYAQCEHARQLNSLYEQYIKQAPMESCYNRFIKSIFWSIFEPITRVSNISAQGIVYKFTNDGINIAFYDKFQNLLLSCSSSKADRQRLIERLTISTTPSRYALMNKGLDFIRTEQERALIKRGHKTQRQTVEDSIWYRLAYHCFREIHSDFKFSCKIDIGSGTFVLVLDFDNRSIHCSIPQKAVPGVFESLFKAYPSMKNEYILPDEQELYFRIISTDDSRVIISPCIRFKSKENISLLTVHKKLTYSSYIYFSTINKFIKLNSASVKLLATGWDESKKISTDEISAFLEKNEPALSIGSIKECTEDIAIDLFTNSKADDFRRIIEPEIITRFERIELCPLTIENETCSISVRYTKGNNTVQLSDLIRARKENVRFLYFKEYVIDCNSPGIHSAIVSSKGIGEDGTLTLSRAALLQFRGSTLSTFFTGDEKLVCKVRQMLEFKAAGELKELTIYNGTLRDYQKKGVQWLLFLYDNNFGGLLCDDMGLGKTHQILAFIASVKEHRSLKGPVLIICPTTVVSHWIKVIKQFTTSLKTVIYHDSERSQLLSEPYEILITTYGILRNDINIIDKVHFDITVFDEAHLLKNRDTSSFGAAASIKSNVKLALTGTPIENSMSDLKSLFDITLPGLLSSDLSDEAVLLQAMNSSKENKQTRHLQRLTAPFILRRLKQSVLTELPPKFEDRRTCTLSADQFSLYQSAIEKRAAPLIEILRDENEKAPYMHIFSLLNYLKQVCNHPALGNENPGSIYESYESDKWELFKELLNESIGSGQKVVVFSQYLGMIEIMKSYLEKMMIGHVVLTGASKKRDQLINTFANDEECKVFVGSLKAGGVGIDLVAGSVVIHYDRWWNAAREDQATDRVHRIGQQRGVQVFKLITEGTIEEKIDRIIERKKTLTDTALVEDSPDLLKQFTREELVELLSI